MDKLLRQLEQDRKRSRDEFKKMQRRADIIACAGLGLLILISIVCVGIFIGGVVFLCD